MNTIKGVISGCVTRLDFQVFKTEAGPKAVDDMKIPVYRA